MDFEPPASPEQMFSKVERAIGQTDHFIMQAATLAPKHLICAWGADERAKARTKHVMG